MQVEFNIARHDGREAAPARATILDLSTNGIRQTG